MRGGGVGCMGGCGGEGGHLAGQLHTYPLGVGHVTPPGSKEVGEGGGGYSWPAALNFHCCAGEFFLGETTSVTAFLTSGLSVAGGGESFCPFSPAPHPPPLRDNDLGDSGQPRGHPNPLFSPSKVPPLYAPLSAIIICQNTF